MAFRVKFVTEKNEPVNRPMWLATGVRRGEYRGYYKWQVTDMPDYAATYVKRETAERWAERLIYTLADGAVLYGFEAEEVQP